MSPQMQHAMGRPVINSRAAACMRHQDVVPAATTASAHEVPHSAVTLDVGTCTKPQQGGKFLRGESAAGIWRM